MAAVPHLTGAVLPHAANHPIATLLRFPSRRGPVPVASDPMEGTMLATPDARLQELGAAWALVAIVALAGFALF